METLYTLGQEMGGTLALDVVIQVALHRVVSASGFDVAFMHFQGNHRLPVYTARSMSSIANGANATAGAFRRGF